MVQKTPIRDFYGKIIGYIGTDNIGNQTAYDFYNKILGRYDAKNNITKDFYGRIIGHGNLLSAIIFSNNIK